MEPRGRLGDYNAAEGRYTIYTTLQRAHPPRRALADVLKVPESQIRVVAGDIGGSFGMKSAVYNEVALVLLGVEGGAAGEMDVDALRSPSSATTRRATTSPRPSWRSTRTAASWPCASRVVANRRLSADRHARLHRQHRHAGRRLRIPRCMPTSPPCSRTPTRLRPYRGAGRPEAAYVIERLVDVAAASSASIPSSCGGATASRRRRCRSRPARLHLRLRRVREEHGHGAQARRRGGLRARAGRRRSAASCAARPLQPDRARRGRGLRVRGDPLRPLRRGDAC